MTTVPFKEEFADDVEDGSKGQTIRGAECYNKTCDYNGGDTPWCSKEKPECFLSCSGYTPRYKVGDTLQLYTGLMQKLYCKLKHCVIVPKFININTKACELPQWCTHQGAKLLKETTCTESFPIKFEDLTEEIARLDGFKSSWNQKWFCDDICPETGRGMCMMCSPLTKVKMFLKINYDAKDGDVFQVIRWK